MSHVQHSVWDHKIYAPSRSHTLKSEFHDVDQISYYGDTPTLYIEGDTASELELKSDAPVLTLTGTDSSEITMEGDDPTLTLNGTAVSTLAMEGTDPLLTLKGTNTSTIHFDNIPTGTGDAIHIDSNGDLVESTSILAHKENIESYELQNATIEGILDGMDFQTYTYKTAPDNQQYGLIIDYLRDALAENPTAQGFLDDYLLNWRDDAPRGFNQPGLIMFLLTTVKDLTKRVKELEEPTN